MTQFVVHQSLKKSTNQSNVSVLSNDRFLNLVVDSNPLCKQKYMFNFILCFCLHTDKHLAVLSQCTSDTQSIHTLSLASSPVLGRRIHLFQLFYYLSTARTSPFYVRCCTYKMYMYMYENHEMVTVD